MVKNNPPNHRVSPEEMESEALRLRFQSHSKIAKANDLDLVYWTFLGSPGVTPGLPKGAHFISTDLILVRGFVD